MSAYDRRIVMDANFDAAVCDVSRAIREEGLQAVARIDVREQFWRHLSCNVRPYLLIEAWSTDQAMEALRLAPDVGAVLPTTFAVYELADGKTVVAAKASLSAAADQPGFREEVPALAAIADQERARMARVLGRLHARGSHATESPAA